MVANQWPCRSDLCRSWSVQMTSCRDELPQGWGAGVTWVDQVQYAIKYWEKLGQEAVSNMVQRRVWIEKLTEADNKRLVRILHEGGVEGKWPRGRPCKKNCLFNYIATRDTYISAVGNSCKWQRFVWLIALLLLAVVRQIETDFTMHQHKSLA